MRLTKRHLKRIIREEYSRLKRRGLISESAVWQHNPNMEEQDCPEGTPIETCADTWAQYICDAYGYDVLFDVKHRTPQRDGPSGLEAVSNAEDDGGYAVSECLEGMDIEGSGNWNYDDALVALFDAIKRANPRDSRND